MLGLFTAEASEYSYLGFCCGSILFESPVFSGEALSPVDGRVVEINLAAVLITHRDGEFKL